jgi:alkanesulfonate monooxygenase SsuD/methylene tetrahydromethanopterin reductase-like flavin-dependent oxidoreductase (luciferase family)
LEIGIFQLLPAPETRGDQEVIAQALREVDLAEAGGFGSVWIAEHHLSSFGLVGAPSVFAAAVAQRTERLEIGYAIAVVPLHHPVRLAEEIAWVDNLSRGRLLVGVGPGFSPFEFAAFGVPLAERHARLAEGTAIVQGLLAQESFSHEGTYWSIPAVTLRPRPYRGTPPPFLCASSGAESLRTAALAGMPVMLGLQPTARIAERVAAYRQVRAELGRSENEIDCEVARFRVLRRIVVAGTDVEAMADARRALAWEEGTARRVHVAGDGRPKEADGARTADSSAAGEGGEGQGARTAGGSAAGDDGASSEVAGGCIGTPETVIGELLALRALGIRHVIAWVNFGDMPAANVRRSLGLLAQEVLPVVGAMSAAA